MSDRLEESAALAKDAAGDLGDAPTAGEKLAGGLPLSETQLRHTTILSNVSSGVAARDNKGGVSDREAAIRERYGDLRESEIELLAELVAAREETKNADQQLANAITAYAELREREGKLREALRWIADPSHVGNYDDTQVVEIHRKWARAALADGEGET